MDAHHEHARRARAATARRARAVATVAKARAIQRLPGDVAPATPAATAVDDGLTGDVKRTSHARRTVRPAHTVGCGLRRATATAAARDVLRLAAGPALPVDGRAAVREVPVPGAAAARATGLSAAVHLHGTAAATALAGREGLSIQRQRRVAAVRAHPALDDRLHARTARADRHRVDAGVEDGLAGAHAARTATAGRTHAELIHRRERTTRAATANRENPRLRVFRQRERTRRLRVREDEYHVTVRERLRLGSARVGHDAALRGDAVRLRVKRETTARECCGENQLDHLVHHHLSS